MRRTRPQTGLEELVGDVGIVRQALDPSGYVFIHGELWRAKAGNGSIPVGDRVRVEGLGEGLVLEVTPIEEPPVASDAAAEHSA